MSDAKNLSVNISPALTVTAEGIDRQDLCQLVSEHFEEMIATSAPESSHALDLDAFSAPEITLFALRQEENLLGCGALKELDSATGELKTMRIVESARGLGIGGHILDFLIGEAKNRGYDRLYLETGSEDFFEPARAMYLGRNFEVCGPFGNYQVDPHSVFMILELK